MVMRPKMNGPLKCIAVASGIGAVVWVLFKFVVTDPLLTLEYLRALAWPSVLVTLLVLLRRPLMSKVQQVLNVEFYGFKADFERHRQLNQQLEEDLQAPIDAVVQSRRDDLVADTGGSVEPTPGDAATVAGGQHVADVTGSVADHASESGPSDDAMQILTALETLLQLQRSESQPPGLRTSLIMEGVRNLQSETSRLKKSEQATRVNIEAIVRRSADWGYDVAQSGSPRLTPDIEWSANGGWRIVSEPPRPSIPQSSTVKTALQVAGRAANERRARHIRRLEEEIQTLQKEAANTVGMRNGSSSALVEDYKKRLQDMDPGNPFAL